MGFQFRKRTKGKDGWLNFSGSKKNGLGASLSLKFGKNVTYNSRGRVTINFGNGLRYVAYKKKKRPASKKQITNYTKSTNTRVEENTLSKYEVLCSVQQALFNTCKLEQVKEDADIQVVVDLYNAVEFVKEEPDSTDNIDLIIVTTNQFKDIAHKINDPLLIDTADTVNNYLRSILPKRPKIKPPKPTFTPEERTKYNRWMIGILFVVIFALQMCTK